MSGAMAQTHQCGQQPVDEDELVLRSGPYSSSPRPGRQALLVLFVP